MSIFGILKPPYSSPPPLDLEYVFPDQPKGALFQKWKVIYGDDSYVINLQGDDTSLVLKIPKIFQTPEEISTQKIISNLVGPPTIFVTMKYSDEKGNHSDNLTLSAQVPLFLDMVNRISKSNAIDESERENQLIKIFEERINVFMYTLSKGFLADFDLCNVGICEIKDHKGESDFGVFLVDYCGAHEFSSLKIKPAQFAKIYVQLTDDERLALVNIKNSIVPDAKFMNQSPLAIFECIKIKDFACVNRLEISDSIKQSLNEAISKKYEILINDIVEEKHIDPPKAVLTERVLKISPELLTNIELHLTELIPERRNLSLS